MTRTLEDAFVLPHAHDLTALDFVIRLDAAADEAARARLVEDYVVTPAVARALPDLFHHLRETVQRGRDYGHVLHGGFGSGKSHLLTLIGLLLEGDPAAWAKAHPTFEALREQHRAWVDQSRLLVIRVHMLSVRTAGAGLDEILLAAADRALVARGAAPRPRAAAHDAVLAEIRAEASRFGEDFWRHAEAAGVVGSAEDLAYVEQAGGEAMDALVASWRAWRGDSAAAAAVPWGQALHELAAHARDQGFGGVVFLVDEFLLWLAEKAGEAFVAAINDLNTVVDHATGRRAAPMMVVFARQRNLREFFPELTSQDRIQERVDHHAKRFDVTQLQDVELRHIVRGRVLARRKDEAAIVAAIGQVEQRYERALADLLGEAGRDVLHDVYPLHPALIDVLVDVSNLMQRERSALRLLYEILAANRTLPLGELVPVGRAFPHVFPQAGVEAAQKADTLQAIHREWYQRLEPALARFCAQTRAGTEPISEERERALEQVLKTVLLGLVSPRLAGPKGERLTVKRLVMLNFADADGEVLRSKVSRAFADLRRFAVELPELQLAGDGGDTVVRYALGQASLGEVLRRAEERVRNTAERLKAYARVLEPMLGKELAGLTAAGREGKRLSLTWRGTPRVGRVFLANVREHPYEAFRPAGGEAFRVVIDYPWDERGHGVEDDRRRVELVRGRGTSTAAAWLPRHLSHAELAVLDQYAAARWVVEAGPGGELVQAYGPAERDQVLEQARARVAQLELQLQEITRTVYAQHGEVRALEGHRDPDLAERVEENLPRIVRDLLDRKHPQHPQFGLEATRARLESLAGWVADAWTASGSTHYDPELGPILRELGAPLELVTVGQSRATLERNGRFLKQVLADLGDRATAPWDPTADALRNTYGLTDDVLDLLLCAVCATGYRLKDARGQRVEPRVGLKGGPLTVERAELLDLESTGRARALAVRVFALDPPDQHRSLAAQDRLATSLREAATAARDRATRVHAQLVDLGAGDGHRAADLKALIEALAPLVAGSDSHLALRGWLGRWPEEDGALVTQARALAENLAAVDTVDRSRRRDLLTARTSDLAERVADCLSALDQRLAAREQDRMLRRSDAEAFNAAAAAIIAELVSRRTSEARPPAPPPARHGGGLAPDLEEAVVDSGPLDGERVEELVAQLRQAWEDGDLVSAQLRLRRKRAR